MILPIKEEKAFLHWISWTTSWQSYSIMSLGMPRGRQSWRPLSIIARNFVILGSWRVVSLILVAKRASPLWSLNIAPKPTTCISTNNAPYVFSFRKPGSSGCQQPCDLSSLQVCKHCHNLVFMQENAYFLDLPTIGGRPKSIFHIVPHPDSPK